VAGLIAKSAKNRSIEGFLAGIFGDIIVEILAIEGLSIVGGVAVRSAGALCGGLADLVIWVVAIILSILAGIISMIDDLIGGAITR
jgi:CDP-diglyceride synthetase